MISKHCGKRLVRLTRDTQRIAHAWKCQVCGRTFTQKRRLGRQATKQDKLLQALL